MDGTAASFQKLIDCAPFARQMHSMGLGEVAALIKATQLETKDIVNLSDGARLGPIKDLHIDLETGRVVALVLQAPRKYFGLMRSGRDLVIPWDQVKKFGLDTVLVDLQPLDRSFYQE
ncbi:YlmC/YmxH family sporulation protein [Desulforamulus ruminis]|uniref:YlmC/YmxH family sporulation protein n=1 Tax=Desulforamulus ruminis TaxID=1564 RepID=UPI00308112D9